METFYDWKSVHFNGNCMVPLLIKILLWFFANIRPVKTDFMFYISSRVRFGPNSGKICTNLYFAIFLAVFQLSKFLMNMLINLCGVLLIF